MEHIANWILALILGFIAIGVALWSGFLLVIYFFWIAQDANIASFRDILAIILVLATPVGLIPLGGLVVAFVIAWAAVRIVRSPASAEHQPPEREGD